MFGVRHLQNLSPSHKIGRYLCLSANLLSFYCGHEVALMSTMNICCYEHLLRHLADSALAFGLFWCKKCKNQKNSAKNKTLLTPGLPCIVILKGLVPPLSVLVGQQNTNSRPVPTGGRPQIKIVKLSKSNVSFHEVADAVVSRWTIPSK